MPRVHMPDGRVLNFPEGVPPEEMQRAIAGLGPRQDAAPDPAEEPEEKSIGGFLENAAGSAWNLAKGTAEGGLLLGKMANASMAGGLPYLTDPELRGMMEGAHKAGIGGIAKGAKEYFGNRYGGLKELGETAYTDPFGLAADVSTVASLGGTAAARAPGLAGRIGRGVAAVGSAIDPMAVAGRAATAAAPYAGKAAEFVGEGLNRSALKIPRALEQRNPGINIPRAMAEEGVILSRSGRGRLDAAIGADDAAIDALIKGSTKTVTPEDVTAPLRQLADERRGLMAGGSLTDEAGTVDARVRQIMDANAPPPEAPQPLRSRPLAPPPVQPGRVTRETASDPGYLYHATNEEGAREIAHSGVRTFKPSHGTDQSAWPDRGVEPRSYWNSTAANTADFAPAEGRSALVRTKQTPDFAREGTGDHFARTAVGPGQLEVMDASGQWQPISRLRGEGLRVTRGGREITLPRKTTINATELDKRLPRAGEVVDGRRVRAGVPNEGSISSSFEKSHTLPGIREVPMSEFDPGYKPGSYNAKENVRTAKLRAEIEANGEIAPLIVAYDADNHPHIVEGGHRFDALHAMGAKSFPARVVLDTSQVRLAPGKAAAAAGPRGIALDQAQRTKVALNKRLAKTFGTAAEPALNVEMAHAERRGLANAIAAAEPEIAPINERLGRRYAVGDAMDAAMGDRPLTAGAISGAVLKPGIGAGLGAMVGGGIPGAIVGGLATRALESPMLKTLAARELFRASRNAPRAAATFEASGPLLTRLALLSRLQSTEGEH